MNNLFRLMKTGRQTTKTSEWWRLSGNNIRCAISDPNEQSNSRSVEKTSFNWGRLGLAAALALFIVWSFQRFRKRFYR